MNKKVIGAVTVVLAAGLTLSGAACWRTLRNGTFPERACAGDGFTLTGAFLPSWDFAELRETNGEATLRVLQRSGTPCSKARNAGACEAAVAAATSKAGWNNGSNGRMPGHHYVVATRGDEVAVVDGAAMTLAAALAPIDSAVEAAVVAVVDRSIGVSCEWSVRTVEGGFEVHLVTDSCFGPADEVIRVGTDGKTTVVSSERGESTCVGSRGSRTGLKRQGRAGR